MTTPQNITDLLIYADAPICAASDRNAMSTDQMPSVDQILDLMKAVMPVRSPTVPDVYLMTYRTEETVKEAFRSADDVCGAPRREMPFHLFGIRYESYPTMEDVSLRAIELTAKGKVVSVLEDVA